MRFAVLSLGITGLLAVCAAPVYSQAMVEGALAGASSSAAGSAASGVGKSINRIFQKVDSQTSRAAQGVRTTRSTGTAPPASATATQVKVLTPPLVNGVYQATLASADQSPQQVASNRHAANSEQVSGIEVGSTRSDVVERLGRPSATVTIPGNGKLEEVYIYNRRTEPAANIELTDGEVSSVESAAP